jgi:hypothetical protein
MLNIPALDPFFAISLLSFAHEKRNAHIIYLLAVVAM